jgi:hypothetical protein
MGVKILVTGGRDFKDREGLYSALDTYLSVNKVVTIIEGGATGADEIARDWAKENGQPNWTFPANWVRYGKAAGVIRNKKMLNKSNPDFVLVCPGGNGTAHMRTLAEEGNYTILTLTKVNID